MTTLGRVLVAVLTTGSALFVSADAGAAPPAVDASSTLDTRRVDAIVRAEMRRHRTPGAQIAIARGGSLLYASGYGYRNVATKAPVDNGTMFEIGSGTKQFTAAAVMQFVHAGKVRLDEPIATYVDGIPSGRKITVRELLTNTSGLPDYASDPLFDASLASAPQEPRDLLNYAASRPLDFAPGTRWEYSNTNYAVLGLLIATSSGVSYQDDIAARITGPAGLAHTTFATSYLREGDVAIGYQAGSATIAPIAATDLSWAYAAGGLYSTASDLVRWEFALYADRVVDAASLAQMTTPETLTAENPLHYGFGLMEADLYGQREIWHNGGLPGFAARDAYFPETGYAIAVVGNTIDFNADPVVRDVVALLVPSVAARIVAQAQATPVPGDDPKMHALAESLLAQAQSGKLDRTMFSDQMNAALTPDLVARVTSQIAPLGTPKSVTFVRKRIDPQYSAYEYRLVWDEAVLDESFALDANGKIVSWLFRPDTGTAPSPAATSPTTAPK